MRVSKDVDLRTEVFKEEEVPSLVTLNEFLGTIGKEYPIESIGGFIYWVKKQGAPKKWPINMWKEKLNEFLTRKV